MLLLHPCPLSLQWYFNEKQPAPFFFSPKTVKTNGKLAQPKPFPHLNRNQDNIETWKVFASQTQLCLQVLQCQRTGRAGKGIAFALPVQERKLPLASELFKGTGAVVGFVERGCLTWCPLTMRKPPTLRSARAKAASVWAVRGILTEVCLLPTGQH